MTPADLATRRWFRSKQRSITSVTEVDRAQLGPGELVVLEVAYGEGAHEEHYLVLLVGGREPADGDGAWRALAGAILDGTAVRGDHGTFVASPTGTAAGLAAGGSTESDELAERRLTVEQSNTSVVLGDRLILKVYRLIEPGINPDLEVSAFLTEAGFRDTPAVAGGLEYHPDAGSPSAAAMLQSFVPSAGDAWEAMLEALARDPAGATSMAATIGELTARMHAALASRPADPAFPTRVATVDDTARWRASAEAQLAQAIASVSGEDHDRLVELAPRVRARLADAFGLATGDEIVTRVHGDYHLGQLLARTDGGFSIIDFEGEPARPLAERRGPTSPLRDVAGMLRSLDYAGRTAERTAQLAAAEWLPYAREAFLGAYGARGPLLDAFELEKACYEIRYEASNRPSWLWLPMRAIERIVTGG